MSNYKRLEDTKKVVDTEDRMSDSDDLEGGKEGEYILGYNNIKFPKAMRFIPDLTYGLIDEDVLEEHPNFLSIETRYKKCKGYSKLRSMIKEGHKIPTRLWPIVPQRTKAWFGIRALGFLTGSTVASFIGFKLPKYRKMLSLSHYYEEKVNSDSFERIRMKDKYKRPPIDLVQHVFMTWGDHENNAIYTLIEEYNEAIVEEWGFKSFDKKSLPDAVKGSDFVNKWLPNIGASPDGIINSLWGKRWLLEVKSPTPFFPNQKKPLDGFFFKVYEPKIKTIYIPQMYLQSLVYGIRNVLHVIYTVEYTYVYKLKVEEKMLALFIRIICKSHKNFQRIFQNNGKGGIPYSIDKDLVKFIEYCNKVVRSMKQNEIKIKSVNNPQRRRKYLSTPRRR